MADSAKWVTKVFLIFRDQGGIQASFIALVACQNGGNTPYPGGFANFSKCDVCNGFSLRNKTNTIQGPVEMTMNSPAKTFDGSGAVWYLRRNGNGSKTGI